MKYLIFFGLMILVASGQPYSQGYSFKDHQQEKPTLIVYNQLPPDDPYHDYYNTFFGFIIGLIPSMLFFLIELRRKRKAEMENLMKEMIMHKVESSALVQSISEKLYDVLLSHALSHAYGVTISGNAALEKEKFIEAKKEWLSVISVFSKHLESFRSLIGKNNYIDKLANKINLFDINQFNLLTSEEQSSEIVIIHKTRMRKANFIVDVIEKIISHMDVQISLVRIGNSSKVKEDRKFKKRLRHILYLIRKRYVKDQIKKYLPLTIISVLLILCFLFYLLYSAASI